MSLSASTTASGSLTENIVSTETIIDDGSDILTECAGGCGKKILFFGHPVSNDWGDGIDGAFCLECRTASLSHGFDDDD